MLRSLKYPFHKNAYKCLQFYKDLNHVHLNKFPPKKHQLFARNLT